MNDAERRSALEAIAGEVTACTRCRLHEGRTHPVPGEGTAATEVMFVGEGPGQNEDLQGRPFVGRAGDLLVKLLASIGWARGEVFITNVVKCRPPGNRDPSPDEIATCRAYLDRQIDLLRPRLVVTLGRFSMERYFPGASISRIHGQPKRVGSVIYYPMFHPAAALHQPRWKTLLDEDFARLPGLLEQLEQIEEQEDQPRPPQAEQLSLF